MTSDLAAVHARATQDALEWGERLRSEPMKGGKWYDFVGGQTAVLWKCRLKSYSDDRPHSPQPAVAGRGVRCPVHTDQDEYFQTLGDACAALGWSRKNTQMIAEALDDPDRVVAGRHWYRVTAA